MLPKFILLLIALLAIVATSSPLARRDDDDDDNNDEDNNDSDKTWHHFGHCDLPAIQVPVNLSSPNLPEPSAGLQLKYVVIGRGTQNYTCEFADSTKTPVQVGAMATLFDASCLVATNQDLRHLSSLTTVIKEIPSFWLTLMAGLISYAFDPEIQYPSRGLVAGVHYFTADKTPYFELSHDGKIESIMAKALANAQPTVPHKDDDVPWLKLGAKEANGIQEVYRVHTSGGKAPKDCSFQPKDVLVEYAAEYWLYG